MDASPGFQLLLDCLKLRNKGNIDFSKTRETIDWRTWKALLIRHGIVSQVYMNLKQNGKAIHSLPSAVWQELTRLFYLNTSRNSSLCRFLNTLVKNLQPPGEKITVIPFKGPVLALQAYKDWTYRSYSDLDLLVDKKDFSRFYDEMLKQGCQPIYPLDERKKKWWGMLGREYVFVREGVHMDVHSRIQRGPGFAGASRAVFAGKNKIKLLDCWHNTLSVEYSLLAICINGTRDGWHRLCNIADLSYLVWNNPGLKWNALVSAAKKINAYTMLCTGLKLSSEFLGLQLPQEINRADIEKTKVVKLVRLYADNLRHGQVLYKGYAAQIHLLRSMDTVWGRFRYICYYLFVPKITDLETFSLKGFLYPLYFLLRPLMLLARMFRKSH
jgi:hypothetical protein